VIVVLPISIQPTIILKALAAGKHVISEKPVAPTVESGVALIQNYETNYKPKGLIWRVAENFEAEPGLRAAAKAIADQKIGKVLFWNLQVLNNVDKDNMWYKTPWRTVPDYQGGFLASLLDVTVITKLTTLTARWRRCMSLVDVYSAC
jgi:predicted dehydrogenase